MSTDLSRVGRKDLETAYLILKDEAALRIMEINVLRADRDHLVAENARWVRIIKKYERRFAAMTRIMTGKAVHHAEVAPSAD